MLTNVSVPRQQLRDQSNDYNVKSSFIKRQMTVTRDIHCQVDAPQQQLQHKQVGTPQKRYTTQSTQTEDLYESPPSAQMLSLMESVDLDTFQPRIAQSIMQKHQSYLMSVIEQNNQAVYQQLEKLQVNSDMGCMLEYLTQKVVGKTIEEIQLQLAEYGRLISKLIEGITQLEQFQDHISFNYQPFEQSSPGWLITPTLKKGDGSLIDSLIV